MQVFQLTDIIHYQRQDPKNVDLLWEEYQSTWQALGWHKPQVALWWACLPDLPPRDAYAAYNPHSSIGDHLVRLLTQADKAMPIHTLLKKLPPGVAATAQQLKKIALQDNRLEVKGDTLIKLSE